MCKKIIFGIIIFLLVHYVISGNTVGFKDVKFPEDFMFGVSTSSYQIEGAWNVDGRGESIWDRIIHTKPDEVDDLSTADDATNSYYLYEKDIQLLEELGVNYYRLSLSWCRILPNGRTNFINYKGLRYYDDLIDNLLARNITPMVTIYHWDMPQVIQDEGGFLSSSFADIFEDYAKLLFSYFGERVKYWITFNEPREICLHGYGLKLKAPQLNYQGVGEYKCAANLLEAHARVYHLYNNSYRATQNGKIGISITADWGIPKTDSDIDKQAANDGTQFHIGLFAHPIFSSEGGYPPEVRARVPPSRLPELTDKYQVKGTYDFMGINHYDVVLVGRNGTNSIYPKPSFDDDLNVEAIDLRRWSKIWIENAPSSFGKLLDWLKENYNDPEIVVTESGMSSGPGLNDEHRAWYYKRYLAEILAAIRRGVKVKGYFPWSLMDNFEWFRGYNERYGLYEVDFNSPNKTRLPRLSAAVYGAIVKSKYVDPDYLLDSNWHFGDPQENFSMFNFQPTFSRKKTWKDILIKDIPVHKFKDSIIIENIVDALNSQVLTFDKSFD